MFVIFLYGSPASGKLTIGKLLSEELSVALFHNHLCVDLVASLFDFGSEGFVELRERIWSDSFETAAKMNTSFVFTFTPETTVKTGMVERLKTKVEKSEGEILFVELRCCEDDIRERLSNSDRNEFGKLTDRDLFSKLLEQGMFDYDTGIEPDLVIDTSNNAPEECLRTIVSGLQERLSEHFEP